MKRIFEINPWKVITHTFNKEDKRLQESMTSTGNEYMGMRGMFEEKYSGDTHKGIYLGGVWFPDKTRVGWWKNGYPEYFGKVINAVDFVSVDVKLDGESVDLAKDEFSDFELALDMKSGILTRSYVVKRGEKKVKLNFERFISVDMKELYADRITVENLSSASVEVEIESSIDADVFNEDSNYDEKFWNVLSKKADQTTGRLVAETIENNFGTPQFTTEMLMANVSDLDAKEPVETDLKVSNVFAGTLEAGKKTVFEKRVVVLTSRDYETLEDLDAAGEKLSAKQAESSFDELKAAQANGWAKRWEKADVVVEGNDESQQGIRFNLFQLFSTYYGNDARLNIGPKGFTGEKYGGATYWDTEGFAVPLYLALADQSVTRNLLEYRHEQLPGAYHNAKQQGLDGALFPMVTFNGIECHNEWEITFEEIHRNGTIAYAIYNYTRYTGDTEYVTHDGFDVLVGIARFWADRVHFSKRKGMYMIHGVTGPNEYENNVNNNWYTNILAKWCLNYANEIADKVDADKTAELGLTSEERAKWHEIADNMYLPEDKELGIFVQHDTFLDKDLTPVKDLPQDQLPLNQHWSWDHILRSPYIKQADVLQGIYYFVERFTQEQKERNFDFYEPLTVHESSLSPSIHAILAADLHKEDKAFEMYSRTARLDLDNYNNDTNDGLHITSMTGSWLAIVQGFAGMRVIDDELQFAPFLPKEWTGYKFRINFRGRLLSISVSQEGTQIDLLKGDDLTIKLNGKDLKLTAK
ncbi:glycoside hydrolase family 65 protein [Lactobacillus ruminis]|uniref:glycoside hydrolase family 65 protein n=1 Tax=Ligilactobacillus ruminis TaxID=1623 RepID=UPI0010203F5B|nr:glycoside hydrolase family 65 protein [Ligilactobacillus ruminis]MSB44350.1 glycoside hydrolase family 65 protein [Ligilactobacillus ruminis]MSB54647.1 glycoside hydrolase family 65 protein [Ligilactobacillus ruminis]MSB56808.1 glycoside hydrolase family 65 protein [Ligilactobacillus ruminis]MSB81792.1 glycoside hydrolase family 65 protein [Ligilactobacillus ruminis]MSB91244.1 glycoside hydrolase family 65 protein [Ligilactobacillus ruminis]